MKVSIMSELYTFLKCNMLIKRNKFAVDVASGARHEFSRHDVECGQQQNNIPHEIPLGGVRERQSVCKRCCYLVEVERLF